MTTKPASPQTHRQVLLDTAKEYNWAIHRLPPGFRFYDLILVKNGTELSFRFDKNERIAAASHYVNRTYVRYPGRKKLDHAIELLRGPLRPSIELEFLKQNQEALQPLIKKIGES